MTLSLARSYAYCERVARQEASNFYYAFHVLPAAQRRSMCALYAFLRVTDDLTDGLGQPRDKAVQVADWRHRLDRALAGEYSHRLHAAFHHTVARHDIPRPYLEAVLDGVAMDLDNVRYATFADLYRYCYRVASAVGLACIHIWGFEQEQAKVYAEQVGIAFQLTNILRDLREDAARGRIYLPLEDLERFDYSTESLGRGERNERFRALMAFEVARARDYYAAAGPLSGLLRPGGRAVLQVMVRTYCGLLDAIERRDYDVFSCRVRLSPWHKLCLVAQALPIRWGWAVR